MMIFAIYVRMRSNRTITDAMFLVAEASAAVAEEKAIEGAKARFPNKGTYKIHFCREIASSAPESLMIQLKHGSEKLIAEGRFNLSLNARQLHSSPDSGYRM
jgi:hypothetical protein